MDDQPVVVPDFTPQAAPKKPYLPLLITAIIAALVAGTGTYFLDQNRHSKDTDDLNAQIAALKVSPAPTSKPTATATATPTAAPTYTTLTSGQGFSFEYPSTWTLERTYSGEGLPHVTYTGLTTNAKEAGVLDYSSNMISATVYPKDSTDGTLDAIVAGEKVGGTVLNIKDTTIGTGKYAAKRYDDGGGLGGPKVTYLIYAPLKNGNHLIIWVNFVADTDASQTPANTQHVLDTLTAL